MADRRSTSASKFLSRFSRYTSGLTMAFGVMVLTGWALQVHRLKGLIPGQVTVKANAAVCFILMGLALWLAIAGPKKPLANALSKSLALAASVVGLLSFLEFLYGWDFGIDQLLFTAGPDDIPGSVRPGLMSPIAAGDFFLLGISIALLDTGKRWSYWVRSLFAIVAAVASVFGILDFVLDPEGTHTYIAPLTALVLFLLSFAVLCARTERGLGALLVGVTPGGELSRRLLPAAVLLPIAIGVLWWKGLQKGLFSDWTGIVIMMVSSGVLLAGLTLWTAYALDRVELAREHAEESVRRLAAIVRSSSDAIVGKTLEGIATSWNPGAEAIYGYSAEEMIGGSLTRVIPAERLDEFQGFLQHLRCGGTIRHHETERIRKDGQRISVSVSISPVKDDQGKVIGASSIGRDITERKRAEEALHRASLYTRSLIEASLDPLVTINKEGQITDVNQAIEKATGRSRQELIGSDFSDYFTEPEKAREGYRSVFEKGFVQDYPLALRNTSGAVMDVLYNATVFQGTNGEVQGVFAAARDITKHKQAQEALQRSEKRYRSLVTATTQVVWTTDPQGMVEDMPMWRAITGQSVDEVRGAGWLNAVHPADRDRTAMVWAQAVKDRSLYDIEYRVRRSDGEFCHFAVRGVPVVDKEGRIVEWVGTCTDITERKRAAEEVRRLNEELERRVVERTAQLEATNKELEAFTYSVSHDLRAPLRHISGFSKILSEEFSAALPPEAQHHVQRIQEGTCRMGQLVDDLLNLGRVGRKELSLQVSGLRSIVDEVIESLKSDVADRQVEWEIGDLPFVECDTALMQQVFQNLLSNALKFTRPRAQTVIAIGQEQRNGSSVVYVRDNGVGFSMKYADKLFGVFQRLHRAEDFEGTGVGLATVQRIVQKHGGRIWAEAELDKGANFYFTLGASQSSEANSKAVAAGEKS